jgi:hypothetical protein
MDANANDCQYGEYLCRGEAAQGGCRRGTGTHKKSAPDSILEAGAATRGGTRIWGTIGVSLPTL